MSSLVQHSYHYTYIMIRYERPKSNQLCNHLYISDSSCHHEWSDIVPSAHVRFNPRLDRPPHHASVASDHSSVDERQFLFRPRDVRFGTILHQGVQDFYEVLPVFVLLLRLT